MSKESEMSTTQSIFHTFAVNFAQYTSQCMEHEIEVGLKYIWKRKCFFFQLGKMCPFI